MRSLYGYNEIAILVSELVYKKKLNLRLKEGKVIRFYSEKFIN